MTMEQAGARGSSLTSGRGGHSTLFSQSKQKNFFPTEYLALKDFILKMKLLFPKIEKVYLEFKRDQTNRKVRPSNKYAAGDL